MYLDLQEPWYGRYDERRRSRAVAHVRRAFNPAFPPQRMDSALCARGDQLFLKNFKTSYFGLFENTIPPSRRTGKRKMLGTRGRPPMSTKPSPFIRGGVIGWMGTAWGFVSGGIPASAVGRRGSFSQATADRLPFREATSANLWLTGTSTRTFPTMPTVFRSGSGC